MKIYALAIASIIGIVAGFASAQTAETPGDAPKISVTKRGTEIARFQGTGEETTKTFQLKNGTATFNILNSWQKHDPEMQKGEGKFSVVLQDDQGKYVDSVIGTYGHFDGARSIEIAKAGNYQLKVVAPGTWEITVEQ